ncbi:MAG: MFS transporter [Saprospiraceae bacterium]|nr:MFS transporter [Saprospiraceae bacterium]
MNLESKAQKTPITKYQKSVIAIVVFTLFTIVVDYMSLPALSAILLPSLSISTAQFGVLVSVYAFSAGASGFLTTGFADRYDRKNMLMVYYGGFIIGMLVCALSHSLTIFIIGRIITGVFGGVVASICLAIVADLFAPDQKGRVMGYVQIAFAASHIIGLPLALYLATKFDWHWMYLIFFILGLAILCIIFLIIDPIKEHLNRGKTKNLLEHSLNTLQNKGYWAVYSNNIILVLGDVMFMTFYAAYCTNNLRVQLEDLPLLFGIGGVATILLSPMIGHFVDRLGKLKVFIMGTGLAMIMVGIFSFLGIVSFWTIAVLHTLLFLGITTRMISSTAIATDVPREKERGSFMALDASFQQISGGIAAASAGFMVFQLSDGSVEGYPLLGVVVVVLMMITILLMIVIHRNLKKQK